MEKNEIVLFETADNEVSLQVQMQDETVWLTRNQMAELFDRDVKTIGKHINNAIREELAGQVVVWADRADHEEGRKSAGCTAGAFGSRELFCSA